LSLVNDALKKARMEAAREEASRRNIPHPMLGKGESSGSRLWLGLLAVALPLVVLGGLFLYRAGLRSAQSSRGSAETSAVDNASERASRIVRTATPETKRTPGPIPESKPENSPEKRSSRSATVTPPITPAETTTAPHRAERNVADTTAIAPETDQRASGRAQQASEPPERALQSSAPTQTESRDSPVKTRAAPPSQATTSEPEMASQPAEPAAEAAPKEVQEFLREATIPGIGKVELGGIAWSGDRPFALVNGRVVRPGDAVSGLTIEQIEPNRVRLRGSAGTFVFRLK